MAESYDQEHRVPTTQTFDSGPISGAAPQSSSTTDQAKAVGGHAADAAKNVVATAGDQAANVRDAAVAATGDMVGSVKDEAAGVLDEAKVHGRRLYHESVAELRTQAETGQARLAELVRSLTDELQGMVSSGQQGGPVTQVAETLHEAGEKTASWLESRGPQDAMTDVRRYAARNPMVFLAAAAGVGFVASRFARGLKDESTSGPELGSGQRMSAERTFGTMESGYTDGVRYTTPSAVGDYRYPADTNGYRDASAPGTYAVDQAWDAPVRPFGDLEDPNR